MPVGEQAHLWRELVGRDEELSAIEAFVSTPTDGANALLIEGEAGIGKSRLWEAAVEMARERGHTLLVCRPVEGELALPFVGLGDLLAEELDAALALLPEVQRNALEVALLLRTAGDVPPDPLACSRAVLALVERLARAQATTLAIDDVQWLDAPTARVCEFVGRRLTGPELRIVVSCRADGDQPRPLDLPEERIVRLRPPSLSPAEIGRLLAGRLAIRLPRPRLLELHRTSAGNPYFALELGRALQRRGLDERDSSLPLPGSLSELVADRLRTLPKPTRQALRIAALASSPKLALVRDAGAEPASLAPAIEEQIVELDGELVRFSHPLLASGVVALTDDLSRRELHRRIADATSDPEERARQLARVSEQPSAEVAEALEQAAGLARGRGAPEDAAELLERAAALTSPVELEIKANRLTAAAEANRDAGDYAQARSLATEAVGLLEAGPARAQALLVVAKATGDVDEALALCERALEEAGEDRELVAKIGFILAATRVAADARAALDDVRVAVSAAEATHDPALAAQALALRGWLEAACCEGDPFATLERASDLERASASPSHGLTSEFVLATLRMWSDEHALAREAFSRELVRADTSGDSFARMHALLHLAQVEWRAGNWAQANRYCAEASAAVDQSGDDASRGAVLWIEAVIAAHEGRVGRARAAVAAANPAGFGDKLFAARCHWVLGFCALSEQDPAEALQGLEPAAALFSQLRIVEPGTRLFAGDLIEALVQTGRLEEAEAEVEALAALAARLDHTRAGALAGRGEALVLAARGELEPAVTAASRALMLHRTWAAPFALARTLLVAGAIARRAKRRAEARDLLTQALELFDTLGAALWAERATAELTRIPGRSPSSGELTEAEQRVAELVAEGLSNKQVASKLFVTVRTVEANLTKIYAKLGIHSRTELASRLGRSPRA